jgi:hypothetical protein
VGVLDVMVMPYHLEHWWGRVGTVTPAISGSFVTETRQALESHPCQALGKEEAIGRCRIGHQNTLSDAWEGRYKERKKRWDTQCRASHLP